MSNGDDVLDNWEEIDEAELTNKLQQLEKDSKTKKVTNLEEEITPFLAVTTGEFKENKTITTNPSAPGTMKLLQHAAQNKILPSGSAVSTSPQSIDSAGNENVSSPLDDLNSTFQPVLMVLHKDADEYQSANYTQPISTQTVKILRRPTQSSEPRNGVRPKQPIKTLQQREQEYAEARLRILGAAKNPEDDATANASPTTSTSSNTVPTTTNTSAAITTAQLVTPPNNTQAKTNGPVSRNQQQQQQVFGTTQSVYNNYYQQQQQQQQQQNLYFQKQQLQQQQQLHHSLSSPTFASNRLQLLSSGLLPTPPIAPVVGPNVQQRHQFQPLPHYHPQQQQQTQQQPPPQQQQQQSWSPVVGGSVSSYTLQRQQQRLQQQQLQQQQQQQQTDILRTPRGPDGSIGFQMRR